jgi:mono/diheme cytochrome c family protein
VPELKWRSLLPYVALAATAFVTPSAAAAAQGFNEAEAQAFTDRYCSSCHNDVDKEGGLDLTSLQFNPKDSANFLTWVKIHDRVQAGEMPPK